MWNNSIKARVNRIIKERIKNAQEKHDVQVEQIEKEHDEAMAHLELVKAEAIEDSATALVGDIIGKK